MPASLADLNSTAQEEAYASLLACCGSTKWAERLMEFRPFADIRSLEDAADRTSRELTTDDWIEAFSSHPRIGHRGPQRPTLEAVGSDWSSEEQAGTRSAAKETLAALAEANLAYEVRFGYIFIVCATSRTSEEMLAMCRERLDNDPQSELLIAAEELRKIARLRLRKLTGVVDLE